MQDIAILFEDNHLLGIVKPVNIPTQADASGDEDLLNLLKEDLRHRYAKPGNVYLGLVHRLDRPVGGAMIFAKTSKAASRLSEAVRTRKLGKTYLAVVRGKPSSSEGRLKDTLLKDERTNTVAIVTTGTAGGKEAILEYKVVGHDAEQNLSLVRIQLLTGRSHQIRVQLSGMGCPLYGDQKYGAGLNTPGEQLALWSVYVGFPHPVSKAPVDLISLPPRVFPWSLWNERICRQATEDSIAGGN